MSEPIYPFQQSFNANIPQNNLDENALKKKTHDAMRDEIIHEIEKMRLKCVFDKESKL